MTVKTAIILMNLGTPDEPTTQSVRRYLRDFLSDQRVIEMPKILWQIILTVFVLTTRPKRVAHAYQSIWTDDSPMRSILNKQAHQLTKSLQADGIHNVRVCIATTYGNPNIRQTILQLADDNVQKIIVLPLYAQYSATSTGAAFDAMARTLMAMREIPSVHFIKEYHDNPLYIKALANSVREFWQHNGQADVLVMSFHGIPKPYADKGDPYPMQCQATAKQLACELDLADDNWRIGFQSRFGAQEWVRPYTDELLQSLAQQGKSVQIISPAFSADCLETLEELAIENKDNFMAAGGKSYAYIPALNDRDDHIALIKSLVVPFLA